MPSKSFVFRETMISSYVSAVAAINESMAGKGLPVRVACARSEARPGRYSPVYGKYAARKPGFEISR